MPAIPRRDASTVPTWRRATGEQKDWFQQNSTVLYIVISAILTILTTIILFLVWRIVLRKKLRAAGFCVPRSRRPKVPKTAEADHSDPYATPYADVEGEEEIDDEERWRRQTIRIEWGQNRRSSFFLGNARAQPAWDAEGQDRLLFEQEKEAGYGYERPQRRDLGGRAARETTLVDSYYSAPRSPLSQLQDSMPRMAHAQADSWYGQSAARSRYAPSFTSSFGHTPDHSEVGGGYRSDSAASGPMLATSAYSYPQPPTKSPQPIHLFSPRVPYSPYTPPKNTVSPLSSIPTLKPDIKPHYHPYPLFATTAEPVVAVIPKRNLPASKPLYLPCPVNTAYDPAPGLSSSTSSLSSRSPSTPHTHPYPIFTTPINYRPPPRSPPSITLTTPDEPSEPEPPSTPWKSIRDSFKPRPPKKDSEEDEYDHYQLPIIRPGSAFVPFPPTLTNFLDKEHRDRARDRMSHLSTASGRPDRSSRLYEMMWEDHDEEDVGRRGGQRGSASRISSIYPPPSPSAKSRGGRASFAASRMSRRPMPSPLRQISEI